MKYAAKTPVSTGSRALWLALVLGLAASAAWAQSISLTYPTGDVDLPDGPEFATQVLGNQLDMTRLRDIGVDYNLVNPSATGGEWIGYGLNQVPYVYVLNPGWVVPNYVNYPHFYTEGTPFGPLNPINADKYTHMSMRMSLNQVYRDWIALWWADEPNTWASHLLNFYDGYVTINSSIQPILVNWGSGYRIYTTDLTGDDWAEERTSLAIAPNTLGNAWGGQIYGFRIDPAGTKSLPSGQQVKFDWIRLYDAASSPVVEFEWNTDNVPGDSYHSIQLWVDDDSSGYDGDLIMSEIENDGELEFKTAALPPGDYYFYLRVVKHENSGLTEIARSGYSGRVRIGQWPMFKFTAPSYTSGEDFATAQLGNPWDFSSSSDVEQTWDLYSIVYSGGAFQATTMGTDMRMTLNMLKNGSRVALDTKKYRYFTIRMQADLNSTINILDRQMRGWGARVTWWNQDLGSDGTYSKPIQLLEGWRSYTVDLWDQVFNETGANAVGVPQLGWDELPAVRYIRIDPMEPDQQVRFRIDDIKICAYNAPANNEYTIRWNVSDSDSPEVVVAIYYGYQTALGYREFSDPVTVVTQAPGNGSFEWNMSGIANDDYYLRAVVTDGVHTQSILSKVPVKVVDSFPRMNVKGDDPTVYAHAGGIWKIAYADKGSMSQVQWGFQYSGAVPGDYDGDGTNDLAVFWDITGRWYIRTVKGKVLAWDHNWGWPGAIPVSGDYDADGYDDMAVYDGNTGYWYIFSLKRRKVLLWNFSWGWPGATPVTGDYDGDGADDMAVLDKNVGYWYIYSPKKKRVLLWNFNWGWKGADFVPGDFDGDGASELTIFDKASGNWFIYSFKRKKVLRWYYNWGYAGTLPVSGDYDADGKTDLVVYDPNTGYWYFMFSGGGYDIAGPWGGPGYVPVSGNYDGQ